jgi:hypothetical protein
MCETCIFGRLEPDKNGVPFYHCLCSKTDRKYLIVAQCSHYSIDKKDFEKVMEMRKQNGQEYQYA